MKPTKALLAAALAAFSLAVFVAAQTNAPAPSNELFVLANPSTNVLAAPKVRITGGKLLVDSDSTKWILHINVEVWSGTTNSTLLAHYDMPITLAQLKTLVNQPNPMVTLQNQAAALAGLTVKP